MKILAIFNQVNEIGKTTTAINLAYALALEGKKVTLLDLSPEAALTTALGLDNEGIGLDRVLVDGMGIDEVIIDLKETLRIVPAGRHLVDYEKVSEGGSNRAHKLRYAIDNSTLMQDDFVIIDCASTLGLLSLTALFASQHVIIPMSCRFESLEGVTRATNIIGRAQRLSGREIKVWLVSVRFDNRSGLCREVRRRVMALFPNRTFISVIRAHDELIASGVSQQSIFEYDAQSEGAKDFRELAQDLLKGRIR